MSINSEQTDHANGDLSSVPVVTFDGAPVFATVAQHYYEKKCRQFGGRNPEKQALRLRMILDQYCLLWLGEILMTELKTSDVVRALRPIWAEKSAIAERARLTIFGVCAMARAQGVYQEDPNPAQWVDNLEYFLPRHSANVQSTPAPSIDYRELPRFFRVSWDLDSTSARALEVMVLTAARPEEVRTATWREFDLDRRIWTIPAGKIKHQRKDRDHMIPLSDRVIEILESRDSELDAVFPG